MLFAIASCQNPLEKGIAETSGTVQNGFDKNMAMHVTCAWQQSI
jgi:hypothetical protein